MMLPAALSNRKTMLVCFHTIYPDWQFPANRQLCDGCDGRFDPHRGVRGTQRYDCPCGYNVYFRGDGQLISVHFQLSPGQRFYCYASSFLITVRSGRNVYGGYHQIALATEPQTITQLRQTIDRAVMLL